MKLRVGMVAWIIILLTSCNDGPDAPDELEIWLQEVALIDSELAGSSDFVVKDPESGISMVITKLGTGLPAQQNNTVDVDYIGRRYVDKFVFDEGTTENKLSGYIPGWQVAFSKLPAGSEATIIIPSLYGYAAAGSGASIPPNTILEFEVKFKEVIPSTADVQALNSQITAIDTYLDDKSITAIEDATGIRYVITTPGGGPSPSWYDKTHLKYSIRLLTDDANTITTVEREPSQNFYSRPIDYIHGMKIGLQKLSAGSKATLYIPAVFAFGAEGATNNSGPSVPANANIIVEVEVVDIL